MGTLGDYYIPHILGAVHSLVRQDAPQNLYTVNEDLTFDRYDQASILYGWAMALQTDTDNATGSDCFVALFELIAQWDLFLRDLDNIFKSWQVFDLAIYSPVHIFGNAAAAYE